MEQYLSKILDASTATDPYIDLARIGDSGGETRIDKDGITLIGDATRWDDMRTNPMSSAHTAARSPILETVANDGSVGADNAVDFQGGHGVVPDYAGLDSTDEYTVEFWVKPDDVDSGALFWRDGFIELEVAYQDLKITVDNSWTMYATDALVAGQTQHVVVTIDYFDNRSYVYVYVNGQEIDNGSMWGYQLAASSNDVYICSKPDGSKGFDGIMDDLICYNRALTAAQVTERYNAGAGTATLPTGITEATDVVMRFDFNENTGVTVDNDCTLGAGFDMTLSGSYAWVTGLLGITTGSLGVMALSFPPNAVTEMFGSVQFSHKYKEGSLVYPHVHWAGADTTAGDVVWKLEYLWVNIGGALQVNTTIVSRTVANDTATLGLHRMNNVPSAGIDGTGKKVSSILQYRFYRDGTDALDTYNGKAFLSEFDIHFEIDTPAGSKTATSK